MMARIMLHDGPILGWRGPRGHETKLTILYLQRCTLHKSAFACVPSPVSSVAMDGGCQVDDCLQVGN